MRPSSPGSTRSESLRRQTQSASHGDLCRRAARSTGIGASLSSCEPKNSTEGDVNAGVPFTLKVGQGQDASTPLPSGYPCSIQRILTLLPLFVSGYPSHVRSQGGEMNVEGTRILFVDDEENIRLTLSAVLNSVGFSVTTAASVPEALQFIGSTKFDVVISDLNIGEPADGFT